MARILIVEDDESLLGVFVDFLAWIGGHVIIACSFGEQALEEMRLGKFNLAIFDINNEKGKGAMGIIKEVKNIDPDLRVIVSSADVKHDIMLDPTRFGFFSALPKPLTVDGFRRIVEEALAP